MFVATSAPTGAPAQPATALFAVQILGRWLVSDPKAGKLSPAKAPSPVEIGYGRPDCSVDNIPNVQLFTTAPRICECTRSLLSAMKLKFTRCRISFCADAVSSLSGASGFAGSDSPKKSSPFEIV